MKAVMKRWVLVSNAALIGISLASVVYIAREVRSPAQIPPAPIGLAAKAGAPIALVQEAPAPPAPRYGLVVSRNLFSPTRSDAAASSPTLTTPKPHLSGVVLRDGMLIAYLEDPSTKRVAAYRTGDVVAGGTVRLVAEDRVVLAWPEGVVTVRLRESTRPRAAEMAPAADRGVAQPGIAGSLEGRGRREE